MGPTTETFRVVARGSLISSEKLNELSIRSRMFSGSLRTFALGMLFATAVAHLQS